MMIEIAQMALSYYPKINCEKIVFSNIMDGMILRALHELAAPSAGQLQSVQMIQSAKRYNIAVLFFVFLF